MGLEGMEIIAIAVVIGLFIVVLKQFGIWEPLSMEGKTKSESLEKIKWDLCRLKLLFLHCFLLVLLFDVLCSTGAVMLLFCYSVVLIVIAMLKL